VAGRGFSPVSLVSSTNETDCHDITKILLKLALNTIILTLSKKYNHLSPHITEHNKDQSRYFTGRYFMV
jgi:ribosomal protein S15P/S13E